jgi:hypothetical protein
MSLPQVIMEDNPPLLRFENAVIHNKNRSIEEGRFIASNVLKVFVRGHGDSKNEVPQIAEKYDDEGKVTAQPWIMILRERLHHGQISENYYKYCEGALKQWKENHTVAVNGTPLESWSSLNKMEVERLKSINVHTIEALADMTDDAMQAYGMGARALKDRAKAFMDTPRDREKAAEKVSAMETQLQAAMERIKQLESQAEPEKRPPGRPKKVDE